MRVASVVLVLSVGCARTPPPLVTPPPVTLPPPVVTLADGVLEGTRAAGDVVAFLGIAYAAPPVGALRWRPPEPPSQWPGTRTATQFGAACLQLPARWLPYLGGSEDCLFLNVWTTQPSRGAPVIVYFHGGSNRAGYSQLDPLGPALSRDGVVFVSANYRLGPMGFFAHPALTAESEHHASGNYGLLDQLDALAWVHANIAAFGGDPARITVMGQSAGAFDICLLMASPLARGLFARAILESGECQSTPVKELRTPVAHDAITRTGEGDGERLARDLGIADGPGAAGALRSVPADAIMSAWRGDRTASFDAIVDGWVVPAQPAAIFADGEQLPVAVLVGSNADEATVFGHGDGTVPEYRAFLRASTGAYADEVFAMYPAASNAEAAVQRVRVESDQFAYGAYALARAMARAGQPAFFYELTYAETGPRAALGAYHGLELRLLSASLPANRAADRLGQQLRAYWTQFAKTGNPETPGLPAWPAFDPTAPRVQALGPTIGSLAVSPQLLALDRIMTKIIAETRAR